jgi:hypothetical protein
MPLGAGINSSTSSKRRKLGSSDLQSDQLSLLAGSSGGSVISIGRPLNFMHWGDPLDAGIDGRVIYQTAEVGLLTRHILINGVREAGNFSLEGELDK